MNPINVKNVVLEELRIAALDGGISHEKMAERIHERLLPMIEGRLRLANVQASLAVWDEPEMPGSMPKEMEDWSREKIARGAVRATKKGIVSRLARYLSLKPTHKHLKRGTVYVEIARGRMQSEVPLPDNSPLVAYCDAAGDWWFRPPAEFDEQSRFIKL